MQFDKTKYEDLSSMAPSPKLQPNPHLDLAELGKQALAYQNQQQKQKKYTQELTQNLRDHLGDDQDRDYYPERNPRADSILYEQHPGTEKLNLNEESIGSFPGFLDV
jgi:hypothetical protein